MRAPADANRQDDLRVVSARRAALIARVAKLEWLTTNEAALYCRRGRSAFEKMVVALRIPCSKPGGQNGERLFRRTALDAALTSCEVAPAFDSPAA